MFFLKKIDILNVERIAHQHDKEKDERIAELELKLKLLIEGREEGERA